jgi:hypothetical protein
MQGLLYVWSHCDIGIANESITKAWARDFYALADPQIAMGLNVRQLEALVRFFHPRSTRLKSRIPPTAVGGSFQTQPARTISAVVL